MEDFIESIKTALSNKNWYVALVSCLTLPDICGKIEFPYLKGKNHYIEWFNKYLLSLYTSKIGPEHKKHIFLSGKDCYALRCSFLHEGGDDITNQTIKETLDNFNFITPSKSIIHCNQMNSTLQLQVDIFCKDIINAVEKWLIEIKDDQNKKIKIEKLLKIF